ncbi:hypothetical protein [Couchioplanes azureus]|nr:hypothetical protein [Couchioplanes caeruleus]
MWRSFWNQLDGGRITQADAVALLASLSTRMPAAEQLDCFLLSLAERRPEQTRALPDTVNVVGTGGGPSTFNISTAAALVAAALGIRVIKTGSRAYTSRHGSIDLLERLGIRPATSSASMVDGLQRHGIAFAGDFVYPRELRLLARTLFPVPLRTLGRFINTIGPFLADVPVTAQVTGVSDRRMLPTLRAVAARRHGCRTWLVANDHGVDELLSFADNVIHPNDGGEDVRVGHAQLGLLPGDLSELAPVHADDALVDHFTTVVSGRAGKVATQTVCLNAAALVLASGKATSWSVAMAEAEAAMRDGAVRSLLDRLRTANGALAVSTRG